MIQREITEQILPWLGTHKIIMLKGARRAGKTVVLQYLEKFLKDRGDRTMFIGVEQKRHLPIFSDAKLFLKFLKDQHKFGQGSKLYVFIDEFQYIRQSSSFLRELHELGGSDLELIVAASTAIKGVKTEELKDIRKIFYVRRLSFSEYMGINSGLRNSEVFSLSEEEKIRDFYVKHKKDIEQNLTQYMYSGGYPEVVSETSAERKMEVLNDIIHGHIEKDISSFLRIENVDAYIQLMGLLSGEVGNLLNHQDVSTRLNIHKKTLGKYLEIIHSTFSFSFIPPYFTNTKKELAKMNKVYSQDAGIVSYFLQQISPAQQGLPNMQRVKNFIFTELRKHGHEQNIFFYRTIAKAEIDFILCKEKEIIPIKIKFGKKNQKVPVVVKNFMQMYAPMAKRSIIITQDELRFEKDCLFIPLAVFPFLDL